MTLECQNCNYIIESIANNFCPECGLKLNNSYIHKQGTQEKDRHNYKMSISKAYNKIAESHNKLHLKFFDKNEISKITNVKNDIYKITSFYNNVTSNLINEIKDNADEGLNKIKDKIMINVDSSLQSIIKTTNDPKVIMVAKALSKNSPKIAITIASFALAGLPYGTVVTQIAGFAITQLVKSGDTSITDKNMDLENSSSINPIIEKIVNQLLHNSSRSNTSKKCINCSYPIMKDACYCSNCGKEIKDNNFGSNTASVIATNPIANVSSPQTVNGFQTVTLGGSASSDPSGFTPLTYNWMQTSGSSVSLSNPTSANPSFVAPNVNQETTLTFQLVVTNSVGVHSTPYFVTITVESSPNNGNGDSSTYGHGGTVGFDSMPIFSNIS